MARVAKTKPTRSTPKARKPARLPDAPATAPDKVSAAAIASRRSVAVEAAERRKPDSSKATPARSPAPPRAATISKGELRAQVEKLEQVIATLRARSRETSKAAKAATARISELEAQVAQMAQVAQSGKSAAGPARQADPASARRRSREIDPGDAVPPGVAVQDPAPLDEEAKVALENLGEHLAHD